jgi:hypothetical protein
VESLARLSSRSVTWVAALALVAACHAGGDDPGGARTSPVDAADGDTRDGHAPVDERAADRAPPDGSAPDATTIDASAPDARALPLDTQPAQPDAATPDAPAARPDGPLVFEPWPGASAVTAVDRANQLGSNVSGLQYQPGGGTEPPALLAVQNQPSKLYRLLEQNAVWAPDLANGWAAGKTLHYPNGKGAPDAEGVTTAGGGAAVYVSTEEDNDQHVSRLSILRFDTAAPGTALTATHEWNLTAELPAVDANAGLEAIAWVPDAHLVARGFIDESTGQAYQPTRYRDHGDGVFLVALEMKSSIYAYALDHSAGTAHRLATFPSGQAAVMDLAFDVDLGVLWSACDNHCGNRITLLAVDDDPASPTRGRFVVRRGFERPSTLPNLNDEGITFAPLGACVAGQRRFFWADDANTGGHALRMGSLACSGLP